MNTLLIAIAFGLLGCSGFADGLEGEAHKLGGIELSCGRQVIVEYADDSDRFMTYVMRDRAALPDDVGIVPYGNRCIRPAWCYEALPGEPVEIVAPLSDTKDYAWDRTPTAKLHCGTGP